MKKTRDHPTRPAVTENHMSSGLRWLDGEDRGADERRRQQQAEIKAYNDEVVALKVRNKENEKKNEMIEFERQQALNVQADEMDKEVKKAKQTLLSANRDINQDYSEQKGLARSTEKQSEKDEDFLDLQTTLQ